MDDSSRPIEARAFDVLPASAAILDADARLVQTNTAWDDLAADATHPVFDATIGDDVLAAEPTTASAVTERIRTVLDGRTDSAARVHPFEDTMDDRVFLQRVVAFTYRAERAVLVLFVDVTDATSDALVPREELDRLESALGVVSHDLRNSLSIVQGYAELLDGELDDSFDSLTHIRDASARAETIIEDALVLAQSSTVIERDPVELESVAREVWASLEPTTEPATLAVEGSFTCTANRGLLSRLFENLFSNALQHAGPDVTVRVGVLPESESATVGFFVEDDGPGLPPDDVGRVFTPGYTTDHEDGYGLGLTIVQSVVDAHGWAISATNGDTGARFEISGIHPVTD